MARESITGGDVHVTLVVVMINPSLCNTAYPTRKEFFGETSQQNTNWSLSVYSNMRTTRWRRAPIATLLISHKKNKMREKLMMSMTCTILSEPHRESARNSLKAKSWFWAKKQRAQYTNGFLKGYSFPLSGGQQHSRHRADITIKMWACARWYILNADMNRKSCW